MDRRNELLDNLEKLHTTKSGVVRIQRNLSLDPEKAVEWCKDKILSSNAVISRKGKSRQLHYNGKCSLPHNHHRASKEKPGKLLPRLFYPPQYRQGEKLRRIRLTASSPVSFSGNWVPKTAVCTGEGFPWPFWGARFQ